MRKTQNVDTELLEFYIQKSGLRLGHIVDTLGISRLSFDKKKKGLISFRAAEVYVLCDILKIPESEKWKIFSY